LKCDKTIDDFVKLTPTDNGSNSDLFYDCDDNDVSVFFSIDNVIVHDVSDVGDPPAYHSTLAEEPVESVSAVDVRPFSAESLESVTIYYQNINRSKTKTSQLFLSAIENDHDIIVLVETNFDVSIRDEEVFDNRYLVYRCDRLLGMNSVKSTGGGVVIAIKKCFQSERIATANKCEELWIRISFENLNFYLCGVYLPHSAPNEFCGRHIESVESVFGRMAPNDLVLICGDYNLTDVKWTLRDDELCPSNVTAVREAMVVDGMAACDMCQVNSIANQNGVFLDLVFCNSPGMLQVALSDDPVLKLDRHHPAFVLTCEVQYLKYTTMSKRISRFNFKKADVDAMTEYLSHVSWSNLFLVNDIDACVANFYDVMNGCFELHVPKFIAGGSNTKYPWFDRELRNLDNIKTKAHKFMKEIVKKNDRPMCEREQAEHDAACTRFHDLRCDFKSLHRLKYEQYIENIENGIKTDPRSFFKFADMKRNSSGYPASMFFHDEAARNPQEIANLFAKFFQDVYVKDDNSTNPQDNLPNVEQNSHKVALIQFTEAEVVEAIMDLDEQKGPGPDGISPSILKKLISVVKAPLTFLFNLSLASGTFPCAWKESFIVPIFKNGEKRDISCYRGISILSVIPKFFEKMVCHKLTPVIRPRISDAQHGFLKGRSTVTNLVEFSNSVIGELENGRQVDGVYTDFSKAFDRVIHNLLCLNLSRDLEGAMLGWSESYLTGRVQRVKLDDYLSEPVFCHSGVPQGSHLGPLFFIDDVDEVLRIFEHVSALGYADDLKLFMTINNIDDCVKFQSDLNRLQEWCTKNKFDLNAKKCKTISFSRSKQPINFTYCIGEHELDRVNEIKDLGVILDNRMTFNNHIETIITKSARMLGFIKRISKEFKDYYTLKTLFVSLVRPNLEYASSVWSPHQACHSERIERIQHKFLRFALRMLHWTSNPLPAYDSRCALLGLECLEDRRTVASALLIRDLLCNRIDSEHLSGLLRFEDNPYARRRNAKLIPFFHRTNYGKFEPLNNAILNFNRYCDLFGFHNDESRDVFRGRLKLALSDERLGRHRL
jgi:Reverse transcriptase (RNA-dependent DNA polymerase)